MNNNFLGIRGLYKTHMDGLKPFNSKSVTYTYIGYTEHNSSGQPILRRDVQDLLRKYVHSSFMNWSEVKISECHFTHKKD